MNEINIGSLDLNLLKTFEALYEEGSASRAGVRLGLTQSAVSAALKRLKTLYHDPLFIRNGRGLSPTPRASELQPLVSDALNKCRETLLLLNHETASYAGRTVIVGLSDDFELALGQPLLQKLHQQSPGLRVVFRQTHSQIAADMLLRHELDLALTAGGFTYRSLSKSHLATGGYACLIASTSDAPSPTLTLDEFIRRPHLLVSHGGYIGLMDEKLTELGLARTVGASTTHFAAIPWLLKDSDLVTTIPAHAAKAIAERVPTLRYVPCPLTMPNYAIELGCRQPALRDRPILRVREALTELTTAFDWAG